MNLLRAWLIKVLATCGYLTYLPARFTWGSRRYTGAGLIGSLAGLATARWIPVQPFPCLLALLGGFFIAVAISDVAEELFDSHDDPRIVIDEWIGYWCTVALLPHSTGTLVLGFILFRVFDAWKPGWIQTSAELPGGWGVVVDDVLAGLVANVLLRVIGYFYAL